MLIILLIKDSSSTCNMRDFSLEFPHDKKHLESNSSNSAGSHRGQGQRPWTTSDEHRAAHTKALYFVHDLKVIHRPADEFTEPIFLVDVTAVGSVLLFLLEDQVSSAAVVHEQSSDEQRE
jgi:hypothetical protein